RFKELITTFFEEFLLLFFPHVHEHIDFQHVSFLSEELRFRCLSPVDVTFISFVRRVLFGQPFLDWKSEMVAALLEHAHFYWRIIPNFG
ncbi:hypothetical protein B7H16_09530, partial [Anoxybacillus ayderensis]